MAWARSAFKCLLRWVLPMRIDLHNYFRSSSSYRVRIALGLKGLSWNYLPVHLNRNGGEQFAPAFRALSRTRWCRCWPQAKARR